MWLERSDDREFVAELAKGVVVEVAPEELSLFDDLVQEYFDDPTPPDPSASASDDPLSFGIGETLVAITPAAVAMVSAVLTYILTEAIRTFQEESAEALTKKIKALFKTKDDAPVPFTTDQLKQIRTLAIKQARTFGVEAKQARQMADALLGALAIAGQD